MHFIACTFCFAMRERCDGVCAMRLLKPRAAEHTRCPADAASGKPTTCSQIQLLKPRLDSEKPDTRVLSLRSTPMLTLLIPCG